MRVGAERHRRGEAKGYKQSDGSKAENALRNHQRGAAAELAVAKHLGIPWDATVDGYQSVPDLGNYEIRSRTSSRPYLRIKKRDFLNKRDRIFISVERIGNLQFNMDGWIRAEDAMIDDFRVEIDADSKQQEWHVPLSALKPLYFPS